MSPRPTESGKRPSFHTYTQANGLYGTSSNFPPFTQRRKQGEPVFHPAFQAASISRSGSVEGRRVTIWPSGSDSICRLCRHADRNIKTARWDRSPTSVLPPKHVAKSLDASSDPAGLQRRCRDHNPDKTACFSNRHTGREQSVAATLVCGRRFRPSPETPRNFWRHH